ncbi:hypothetical protein PJP10_00845 [Mycobacterium kansasii]
MSQHGLAGIHVRAGELSTISSPVRLDPSDSRFWLLPAGLAVQRIDDRSRRKPA